MIFEKAIEPLRVELVERGFAYTTLVHTEACLREYFKGNRQQGDFGKLIEQFVDENLVEAPTSIPFRVSIMTYTFGYLARDLVYMERFPKNAKDYRIHKAHSELSFANALIQWTLLCEQMGLDWDEMLALGGEHLRERYKDFHEDGWVGV